MNKQFLTLLLLALAAYGQQQKRIAIVNTEDDGEPPIKISELTHLTDRLREIANKTLPKTNYAVMTQQSILAFLGSQENMIRECKESESCLAKLGRKINADYIGQARIGRFGKDLTIKVEIYESGNGNLISSFTGMSREIYGLLSVLDENAPALFKKLPSASGGSVAFPSVAGGISNLERAVDYELDSEKRYVVNLSTEPSGAVLSFNGVAYVSCKETPCKTELREGNVRIIANMEQYEIADTTVFIKQNNQNIAIKLRPNFGVLEINPAYLDGIGNDKPWDLSINDKLYSLLYSLGEINLSPNKYKVKLSHECYENISFNVGINKGKREVFDMAGKIKLKKGGLDLSAERNGEPASEPVFINDRQVGETPFSGSVPLCAKIEIGKNREMVDVELKHNEKIRYTHHLYYTEQKGYAKNQEKSYADVETDTSSAYFYISFYKSNVTSFYEYKNLELRKKNLDVIFGGEAVFDNSYSIGLFFGGGSLWDKTESIGEIIAGVDVKKLFWLWPERIAIPISLGLAWRLQMTSIENRLVAEFIDEPKFQEEPGDFLDGKRDLVKHNFDIMPSMDLQIFIYRFSLYVGYMYRATLSGNWEFDYKIYDKYYEAGESGDHFKVPDKYDPLKNSKEEVFGIPGTLRFGIKYKYE